MQRSVTLLTHRLQSSLSHTLRGFSNAETSPQGIVGACVLERLPVVLPFIPDWEAEYLLWQQQITAWKYKQLPAEFTEFGTAGAEESTATWQPAARETEADRRGNTSSLERALDKRLFLLVRHRGEWQFPQRELLAAETVREAAERALSDALEPSPSLQLYTMGNSPIAHFELPDGRRVFYVRSQLIRGDPKLKQGSEYEGFAWHTKEELKQLVKLEPHSIVIQGMLSE